MALQIENFDAKWAAQRRSWALRRGMEITGKGLVLGAGTLLARMARDAAGRPALLLDGEEARILALLAAAYGRSVPASVIGKLHKASDLWGRGETALAHIHLSHAGLPPFDNHELAFRLFAANEVLEAGLSARTLMKSLGLDPAPLDLLQKYSPDQPRVPAGSGRESGQWTSGDGGGVPRLTFVQRVEIRMPGATMSDANSPGIVPGAQYAQVSPTPILTQKVLKHIVDNHGTGWTDPEKGRFIGKYATEDGIRNLITDVWNQATPDDLAATDGGRVIIAASSHVRVNGEMHDDDVGFSGERTEIKEPTGEFGTPSVKTNLYIVILDSDMRVRTCYPINPEDLRNPRNLPDD